MPQKVTPTPRPPRPFPQWLLNLIMDGKYQRFIMMFKQLSINVFLVEAHGQMPDYAKFMNHLITKKRLVTFEDDDRMQHYSAIATRSLVQKKEDLDAFTIPCTIRLLHFAEALCDLGEIMNLMSLYIYNNLGLGDPMPIVMLLHIADVTVKRPIGILHDVLVKVESFIFAADFLIFFVRSILRCLLFLGGHSFIWVELWLI